jgi:sodium-dependent phosphate transporter
MYGMLTALFVAGCWLLIATYYLMPVSTTHSIIGAIMGFSIVVGGGWGVQWNTQRGSFPYSRGLLPVVLSWFFSPLIGGILSAIIFNLNRFFILRSKHSMHRALWSIPFLIFITLFINIMFVLAKGAASYMDNTWPCTTKTGGMFGLSYTDCTDLYNASAWIAAVVAVGIALTFGIGFMMYVRHLVLSKPSTTTTTSDVEVVKPKAWEDSLATDKEMDDNPPDVKYPYPKYPENDSYLNVSVFFITFLPIAFVQQCKRGLFTNIHTLTGESAVNAGLSDNAEVFDFDTERVYQWLQVMMTC